MRLIISVLMILGLMACVTPIKPANIEQQIAVAESALTGVYNSIAALSEQGRLSSDDFDRTFSAAEEVEATLLLSREALVEGNQSGALEGLQRAQRLLLLLEQRLLQKEQAQLDYLGVMA